MNRTISPTLTKAFVGLLIAFGALCVLAAPRAFAAQEETAAAPQLVVAQAEGLEVGEVSEPDNVVVQGEPVFSGVSVGARSYVKGKGWLKWVAPGKTAGTKSARSLNRVQLKLSGLNDAVQGHVYYTTYDKGKGWSGVKADGKSSGRTSAPVKAIKVWLSGTVSVHYDILYRVYIKGKGWQPWAKNKARAGRVGGKTYISALQVKLSPKTEEAAGRTTSDVGVLYETRMKSSGWQSWKLDGKKAGKTSKNTIVDGFALKVDAGTLTGGIKYRANVQGKFWRQGWKSNGKTAGVSGKRLEALQINLTGEIAKNYNVYYCAYVYRYGWLDWATNGETAGSTSKNLPIAAVKVKLVSKAATAAWEQYIAANGDMGETTVNMKLKTMNGIDIASYQAGIPIKDIDADFVIVKATGGKGYENPYFKIMANATLKSGKLLGLYHFAREASCPGSAKAEADHFLSAIEGYVGKAVLVLDWERDYFLGPSWVKKFLDRVYEKTGVRPLIYMSKSYTRSYDWSSVAENYKLWVAQYSLAYQKGTGYVSEPWTDEYGYGAWTQPTIFQYTSAGRISGYNAPLDLDIFYGRRSDWMALAAAS